jgi:hypothetical protein
MDEAIRDRAAGFEMHRHESPYREGSVARQREQGESLATSADTFGERQT